LDKEQKKRRIGMLRRSYATDLTDEQWTVVEPLIPAPLPNGRPAIWPRREILNAILYVLKTGCAWHLLPHDFPPYSTVFWYFRRWRKDGVWEQLNTVLREKVRVQLGREPQPSAVIIDSQSVKTTEKGG
jgi:putative transposase